MYKEECWRSSGSILTEGNILETDCQLLPILYVCENYSCHTLTIGYTPCWQTSVKISPFPQLCSWCSGGFRDLECLPIHPDIFSILCSFFLKNWQIRMLPPTPDGWHPLLRGILDPHPWTVMSTNGNRFKRQRMGWWDGLGPRVWSLLSKSHWMIHLSAIYLKDFTGDNMIVEDASAHKWYSAVPSAYRPRAGQTCNTFEYEFEIFDFPLFLLYAIV